MQINPMPETTKASADLLFEFLPWLVTIFTTIVLYRLAEQRAKFIEQMSELREKIVTDIRETTSHLATVREMDQLADRVAQLELKWREGL